MNIELLNSLDVYDMEDVPMDISDSSDNDSLSQSFDEHILRQRALLSLNLNSNKNNYLSQSPANCSSMDECNIAECLEDNTNHFNFKRSTNTDERYPTYSVVSNTVVKELPNVTPVPSEIVNNPSDLIEQELREKALISLVGNFKNLTSTSISTIRNVKNCNPLIKPRFVIQLSPSSSSDDEEQVDSQTTDTVKVTTSIVRLDTKSSSLPKMAKNLKKTLNRSPIIEAVNRRLLKPLQTKPSLAFRFSKIPTPVKASPKSFTFHRVDTLAGGNGPANMSLEAYNKYILRQSDKVNHLKLTLKRLQKVFNDRKRAEARLAFSVASTQSRLKREVALHTRARLSAIKVFKQKSAISEKLNQAELQLKCVSKTVDSIMIREAQTRLAMKTNDATRKIQKTAALKTFYGHLDSLLHTLERSNFSVFALFFYYDCPNNRKTSQNFESESSELFKKKTINKIDIFTPICPFFLDGNCLDLSCKYQHPKFESNSCSGLSSLYCQRPFSDCSAITSCFEFICPVCGISLEYPESLLSNYTVALYEWHLSYINNFKSNKNCEQLVMNSRKLMDSSNDVELLLHYIFALQLLQQAGSKTTSNFVVDSIFDCVQEANLLSSARVFAALASTETIFVRRTFCKRSLKYLLCECHHHADSFKLSADLINPIMVTAYYLCKLEFEVCGPDSVKALLSTLLCSDRITAKQLPLSHPSRWGIWYLRILVELYPRFPPEYAVRAPCFVDHFLGEVMIKLRTLFEEAKADLNLPDSLFAFISECQLHDLDVLTYSCMLCLIQLYVNYLSALEKYELATQVCVDLIQSGSELTKRHSLFFPMAIYYSDLALRKGINKPFELIAILSTSQVFPFEFTFYFSYLAYRTGEFEVVKHLLSELVGSVVLMTSFSPSSIYSAFRTILAISDISGKSDITNIRMQVYFWLCCALFHLIYPSQTSSFFGEFIAYMRGLVDTDLEILMDDSLSCPISCLFLHMGLMISQKISILADYIDALDSLFFLPMFLKLRSPHRPLPPWFLACLQRIDFSRFSEDSCPSILTVRLVETFGHYCLLAIYPGLLSAGFIWLVQSLFSIVRLECPRCEDFWLTSIALGKRFSSLGRRTSVLNWLRSYLLEQFSQATKALPYGCSIWRNYAAAVRDCFDNSPDSGMSNLISLIESEADKYEMREVVSEILKQTPGTPIPSQSSQLPSFTYFDF